ncbi:MAG: carbohydrate-binding domain-containing protein [Gemmiger sp.]|nr:carbohydrate-binding domain-containing protein [Gemmiger sp.]
MKHTNKFLALLCATALFAASLEGCAAGTSTSITGSAANSAATASASSSATSATALSAVAVEYTDRDKDTTWDAASAVTISCSGTDATITGGGATLQNGVLTITAAGSYLLSGSLDGQILVNVADTDKVQLVFNNLAVTSPDGPALYIQAGDKIFVTLAEGSQNSLADSITYTLAEGQDEPNACLYSKADLTINGTGSLDVTGNKNHGIFSKDDLKITGGEITVNALNDGIKGKDCVAICAGTITVVAGGDGIQASNTEDATLGWVSIDGGRLTITADGDGIQAETVLQLNPETLAITAGGGNANAAAKAGSTETMGHGGMGGRQPGNAAVGTDSANTTAPALPGSGNPDASTDATPPDGSTEAAPPDGSAGATPPDENPDAALASTASGSNAPATAATTETNETNETNTTDENSAKGLKSTTLLVAGGTITVDAADDALHANGNATIAGGYLTLASGDDGIHADSTLCIAGGNVEITTSYEGLEGSDIEITGGYIALAATDDGLNAAGGNDSSGFGGMFGQDNFTDSSSLSGESQLNISGGTLIVNAQGDGLDSNGAITVSGGVVLVSGPTNDGNGAIDTGTAATITGGIVVAAGASGMAVNFDSSSTQGSWLASTGSQTGGTTLTLADETGNILASWAPAKAYSCVVVSCPGMVAGGSYTLSCGGTVAQADSDGFAANGALASGTQVAATTLTTLTQSDITATMGSSKGGGGAGAGINGGKGMGNGAAPTG